MDIPAIFPIRRTASVVLVLLVAACASAVPTPSNNTLGMLRRLTIGAGTGDTLQCVTIPAGRFQMGAPDSDSAAWLVEKPRHEVTVNEFCLGIHPITVGQFRHFVESTNYATEAERAGAGAHGYNPELHKFEGWFPRYNWRNVGWTQTDSHPAVNISRNDAQAFIAWANRTSMSRVRLPTEEEWEYACRAGTTTRLFTGDALESLTGYANIADSALARELREPPSFHANDGHPFTAPVAQFKPNPWGLYDMLGNSFEWVSNDFTTDYSEAARAAPTTDGVVRGGAYFTGLDLTRCSARGRSKPSGRYAYFGFRIVVER